MSPSKLCQIWPRVSLLLPSAQQQKERQHLKAQTAPGLAAQDSAEALQLPFYHACWLYNEL